MKALTTGIYSKLAGSALTARIGTRLYKGRAPASATYPYIVYSHSNYPDDTFTESLEIVPIQFSIFSTASGTTEAEDIYADLETLYDNCDMTITGETLIYMKRKNAILMPDEHTTLAGTIQVWAYHVDYEIMVQIG